VDRPAGISAQVLAERSVRLRGVDRLSPERLEAWLVGGGFAVDHGDGLLRPTAAAVEIGGALQELEGHGPHPKSWTRRRA
jgi:hypothetical protein